MKYFIDTEFIEGFHKSLFGKRRHFIDLISIGIVCEDGRTYYAISNEFNYKDADDWVKENVISKLPQKNVSLYDSPRMISESLLYKSNKDIRSDIIKFCSYPDVILLNDFGGKKIEFYGYYSDYDWVLFCSLFGRMIDLPKGFPMYCIDLKQSFDEDYPEQTRERVKQHEDYPKQTNEHNALDDAKWNYELYKFITNK